MIPKIPATTVNPEAGYHSIAAEPKMREAARVAAEASYAEFPYLQERYGERGMRFGLSDAGWLITLCDLPPAEAKKQVRWLGGLLSSRGMPQIILEHHLHVLSSELEGKEFVALKSGADDLRQMRERVFRSFDEAVRDVEKRIPGYGRILASAVADERNGIDRAVPSIEEWDGAPKTLRAVADELRRR